MIKTAFDKYGELMATEGPSMRPQVIRVLVDQLYILSSKHQEELKGSELNTSVSIISKYLVDWYTRDGDWLHRASYIKIMRLLGEIETPQQQLLLASIREYASNAPPDSYNSLDELTLKWLVDDHHDQFRTSALRDLSILQIGVKYMSDTQKVNMVAGLLDKFQTIPLDQKTIHLDMIFSFKNIFDPALITRIYDELLIIKEQKLDTIKKYLKIRGVFNPAQKKKLREEPIAVPSPS